MTVGIPSGFPTPSSLNDSVSCGSETCKTSLSDDAASVHAACPLNTTSSRVRLHHSTLEANELGFEFRCPEKSEYRNFSRDGVVDLYVWRSARRGRDGPGVDMKVGNECGEALERRVLVS